MLYTITGFINALHIHKILIQSEITLGADWRHEMPKLRTHTRKLQHNLVCLVIYFTSYDPDLHVAFMEGIPCYVVVFFVRYWNARNHTPSTLLARFLAISAVEWLICHDPELWIAKFLSDVQASRMQTGCHKISNQLLWQYRIDDSSNIME